MANSSPSTGDTPASTARCLQPRLAATPANQTRSSPLAGTPVAAWRSRVPLPIKMSSNLATRPHNVDNNDNDLTNNLHHNAHHHRHATALTGPATSSSSSGSCPRDINIPIATSPRTPCRTADKLFRLSKPSPLTPRSPNLPTIKRDLQLQPLLQSGESARPLSAAPTFLPRRLHSEHATQPNVQPLPHPSGPPTSRLALLRYSLGEPSSLRASKRGQEDPPDGKSIALHHSSPQSELPVRAVACSQPTQLLSRPSQHHVSSHANWRDRIDRSTIKSKWLIAALGEPFPPAPPRTSQPTSPLAGSQYTRAVTPTQACSSDVARATPTSPHSILNQERLRVASDSQSCRLPNKPPSPTSISLLPTASSTEAPIKRPSVTHDRPVAVDTGILDKSSSRTLPPLELPEALSMETLEVAERNDLVESEDIDDPDGPDVYAKADHDGPDDFAEETNASTNSPIGLDRHRNSTVPASSTTEGAPTDRGDLSLSIPSTPLGKQSMFAPKAPSRAKSSIHDWTPRLDSAGRAVVINHSRLRTNLHQRELGNPRLKCQAHRPDATFFSGPFSPNMRHNLVPEVLAPRSKPAVRSTALHHESLSSPEMPHLRETHDSDSSSEATYDLPGDAPQRQPISSNSSSHLLSLSNPSTSLPEIDTSQQKSRLPWEVWASVQRKSRAREASKRMQGSWREDKKHRKDPPSAPWEHGRTCQ